MEIGLDHKLAFLGTPGRLDTIVETIETHMSWVFLTADRAFKLKKPVALPYLDHRPPARRRHSCMNELVLGRRLAPSVYLDVVPLVVSAHGLALGHDIAGEIVDWLVVMRRLDARTMLPHLLATGAATTEHANAVGDLLVAFYRAARRAAWSTDEYRRRMRATVSTYAGELATFGLPADPFAPIATTALDSIDRHGELLDRRILDGRVVDAHGDLRPDHVCLETPPAIIDPLEFDDELRTLDAASELAFFALECDRLGARWFGDQVLARYSEQSGDAVPAPVFALYLAQHALIRAVIALRHLADMPRATHAKWRGRADEYLVRARRALAID